MKKSQVLAALALAFALGVAVIPSASTYAAIQSTTADSKQIADITKEAKDLVAEADRQEDYADYKILCEKFDCGSKLIEDLKDVEKNLLPVFKRGLSNADATNAYIVDVNRVIANADFEKAISGNHSVSDSRMKQINTFTGSYNTLSEAYSALTSVLAAAKDNVLTLTHNYDNSDQLVKDALDLYRNIIWDLNFDGSNTATDNAKYGISGSNSSALLVELNTALNNVFNGANGFSSYSLSAYTTAISNIDEDVALSISKNKNWNATTSTDIQFAENVKVIMDTAKTLPKYGAACAMLSAENNVKKIYSDNDEVDYKEAQSFIAALTTAISNYRKGINPSTSTGTGEGTNKEDDEKTDLTSPDTGVLNAEGNATTTVAMVAGVATALTAAGAGVVAYRNARRSTRK